MPSTAPQSKESFTFQAEIKRLLHLLANSLYQSKEIAIRELVSNASDALDKFRHVALSDPSAGDASALAITIESDQDAGQLRIVDNGIGMSHEELVHNLGTIAHSGSLEFLSNLTGDARKDLSLIGQFGVGFYSAFMIADVVRVRSRGFREEQGWEWESDGTGSFTVSPVEGLERGTAVVLHLRDDVKELLDASRIKDVLRRYSSFVPHPIRLAGEVVNDVKPIWVEPRSRVTEEQYVGFYRHLTHHGEETPLWHVHVSTDSPIQFHAVLYCPPTNLEVLGFGRVEHGLHLCAKRILVQSDCRELLPEYLRFVVGLVDSEDLPLNVSRETLQDNAVLRKIRGTLVRKILDRLDTLAVESPAQYESFHAQFGRALREGAVTDFEHHGRLAKLMRFPSTHGDDPSALVGLDDYIARSPAEQKEIYYLGGPDLTSIRGNPNLEVFRKRNWEVLLLADPTDEFALASVGTYADRPLRSIDSADLAMPPPSAEESKPAEPLPGGFGRVLELFRSALGEKVRDVRESTRLTDSPCCLVHPEAGVSAHLQKILKQANKDFPLAQRILEVNPASGFIRQLAHLSINPANDDFIRECGAQLYDNALLLEGAVPDSATLVKRVQQFMDRAASKMSTIIH